jgi:hypothetical protein
MAASSTQPFLWAAIDSSQNGDSKGVQMFISDKCVGPVENFAEFYPDTNGSAAWFMFIATCELRCQPAR